jgi:hypothetical protein
VAVFVLDRSGKPLMPCSEKRARKLLSAGRARAHRLMPFAVRLVDRRLREVVAQGGLQAMHLSLDPGSKTTGVALSRVEASVDAETGEILAPVMNISFLMELTHRGAQIKKDLLSRAQLRRGRRSRNFRYRAPRFDNRTRPKGWLAPSLAHRVLTTSTWVRRLRALAPVTSLAQELVQFDMQAMQAEEQGGTIEGVAYQRRTLAGYEVGEYLLAKWARSSRTRNDAFGFPRGYLMREKSVRGFRTGDMVQATVPSGKKAGVYTGRVAVRATGSFNIQTGANALGVVQGISHKRCVVLMRGDGYSYSLVAQTKTQDGTTPLALCAIPPSPERLGFSRQTG